jgi:hypothetical protein
MFFPSMPGIFEVERFSGTDGKALKPEELKKVATCRVSRRRVVGRGLLKGMVQMGQFAIWISLLI